MSTEIKVALVFEQEDSVATLKAALGNAGVQIVAECRASALAVDASAILASGADAIVVNLDADLADLLDEVTDALDASERPVIFNDPTASSDLSGWDRARWMRHLSAKLKGNSDFTPPAPPGAESIPAPVVRRPQVLPVSPVVATDLASNRGALEVSVDLAAEAESIPIAPVDLEDSFDGITFNQASAVDMADQDGSVDELLDLSFEPEAASSAELAAEVEEFSLDSLNLEPPQDAAAAATPAELNPTLEIQVEDLQAETSTTALTMGDDIADLDALFDEPFPTHAPDAPTAEVTESPDDLDALFSGPTDAATGGGGMAAPSELTDLDAMFREFEAAQAAESTAEKSEAQSEPVEPPPTPAFKGLSDALNWSLEPVEEEAPPARPENEAIFEWRLDDGAPTKPVKPVDVKPEPPAKAASTPAIPADLAASLALADLRLLDSDDDAAGAAPAGVAVAGDEFETLDLSAIDLDLSDADDASIATDSNSDADLGFAELDFDLGLDVADAAAVPTGGLEGIEAGDDLDALFAPAQAAQSGLKLADLDRLFVLGASIGGPEAIKAFLARIPGDVAAAFVVAQHMGAEFLEMMAAQLDAATPLKVRYPKPGERLRHGEVVVAPAAEQISIDDSGHLRFSGMSAATPYSPSIDQLVRDAADRFGDQVTLILFSGMGTDAVEGGRYLNDRGGQVWAQDRSSCVIASMIDAAKSQGIVKFEGSPVQLAERVIEVLA